jgi:hypothetical protein
LRGQVVYPAASTRSEELNDPPAASAHSLIGAEIGVMDLFPFHEIYVTLDLGKFF